MIKKNNMKQIKLLAIALLCLCCGCTKYLDAVPDHALTVPATLKDFQQLMENEKMFNNCTAMGEFGTDDLYLPETQLASQPLSFRNGYIWAKDVYEGETSPSWDNGYATIYYANIVLKGVTTLEGSGTAASAELNALKGWALFARARAFYDLEEVFGQPYRPASAATDLGVPLKLGTDLEEKVPRATVAATYQQIIKDLEQAVALLPAEINKTNRSKPSRSAAAALLARVYLVMQNYEQSLKYAASSLELYSTLIDYNTVSVTANLPFSPMIDEVVYNAVQINYFDRFWEIERPFYNTYAANDLRKVLFFKEDAAANSIVFKGFYSNTNVAFNGLATDELYLTKAECQARLGQGPQALETLNALLVKRYKKDTYLPYTTAGTADVLGLILTERRKECLFRNLRWADLRRLNQDARFAKTLTRTVSGVSYQLPPNSLRYAMPIPDNEIRSTGIVQNAR